MSQVGAGVEPGGVGPAGVGPGVGGVRGAGERLAQWLAWRSPVSGHDAAGHVQPDFTARRATREVWIVMGLSLGQSAVYAVISLVAKLTAGPPLAAQTSQLNVSQSPREYLDLTYQLAGMLFALVPVALAIYLLGSRGRRASREIGLDATRPWHDAAHGALIAAAIGIPGLGLYMLGRALGMGTQVEAANLGTYWWTVPVLILSALQNGLLEEVVVVGYLHTRLEQLRWERWQTLLTSALLRGSYHLYQGFSAFIGNAVMGAVFGWYFQRTRRVMPLVVAHTIMDIVTFVGYALLPASIRNAL